MSNDERPDPLADLFTLFLTPLSGTVRSVEQFRRGVDEFLNGVENFNRSMANLNETTERLNSLLADVEEPIRAAVPQVTRTVRAADEMMQVVSGPAMAVAPGLNRLAETLNTPAFHQLPAQLNQFSEVLGEVSRRLGPLTQVAESAGGILGGLRVPGMSRPQPPADSGGSGTRDAHDDPSLVVEVRRVARPDGEAEWSRADKQSSPRRTPSTNTTGKSSGTTSATAKSAAKKSAARKSANKKSAARKSATKKSAGKKSPGRKSPAKKSATPTSAGKNSPASTSTTGASTSDEKASSGDKSATTSASG
jgi:hypothetical protein